MKTISIVVPCYNEEENVEALADALREMFQTNLPEYGYEIIFIDNDSKDKTRDIIRKLAEGIRGSRAFSTPRTSGSLIPPTMPCSRVPGTAPCLWPRIFRTRWR